jgi:hypothetical protein
MRFQHERFGGVRFSSFFVHAVKKSKTFPDNNGPMSRSGDPLDDRRMALKQDAYRKFAIPTGGFELMENGIREPTHSPPAPPGEPELPPRVPHDGHLKREF